jgi:hypothetical protein
MVDSSVIGGRGRAITGGGLSGQLVSGEKSAEVIVVEATS